MHSGELLTWPQEPQKVPVEEAGCGLDWFSASEARKQEETSGKRAEETACSWNSPHGEPGLTEAAPSAQPSRTSESATTLKANPRTIDLRATLNTSVL
jgi:hypothetical protein